MEIRQYRHLTRQSDLLRNAFIIGGLIIAACLLGIAVTAGASDPTFQLLLAAVAVAALFTGALVLAFDIPFIIFVRAAFIASFFIKIDMNLFKIDEMEDPSGLNISATLVFGLMLLAYDRMKDERGEKVFPAPFWFLIITLFVFAAASVLLAGPETLGFFSLFSLATSILVAFVTASHFGRGDRIRFLIVWLGVGILFTGLVALAQLTFGWPLELPYLGTGTEEEMINTQSHMLGRVPAFLRTPTEMAWVLSALVPLVIAPIVYRVNSISSLQKKVLTAAGLAAIVGIVLSLARGSWIGMIAAILLIVIFGWFRLSKGEKNSFLASAAGILLLTAAVLTPFSGKIYDRLTDDDMGSAAIRLPLMENALIMIEDNAVAGVGLNNYRSAMTKYDETGIFVSTVFPNPVHNIFAHITAEVGIVGGILFCLILAYGVGEGFRNARSPDRLVAALAMGVAIGLFAFVISGVKEPGSLGSARPPIRTCFLLLGTAMAVSRIRRHQDLVLKD